MAVSFDLYGTIVLADRPREPWSAVADALASRGVAVPSDWESAYRTSHSDGPPLRERSLVAHTRDALASQGVSASRDVVHDAVLAAFDGPLTVAEGAESALTATQERGPVGVLSNCSVLGLVERTLDRAGLHAGFDAVVTSVDCGWRKPHERAFTSVADALGVDTGSLVHVGDDPRTDGGGRAAGVSVLLTDDRPLAEVPAALEGTG